MSVSLKPYQSASDFIKEFSSLSPAQPAIASILGKEDGNACYRVLIVDDNPSIHDDFRKILCPASDANKQSDELETLIFGTPPKPNSKITFELDSAFQGQSALEKLNEALEEGRPYALAFVDIQMPPGWDGVETVNHLWDAYPGLQVVICTAYSTYSWEHMRSLLKQPDSLLLLKKPFDQAEIQQMAHTLARKWELNLLANTGLSRLNTGIRNLLLAPHGGTVADTAANEQSQPEEDRFVNKLELLSQTLETTRTQLRHAEQQLVHSEKMASLGRLSAGILHEINNPLNYAMAALTMLENNADGMQETCRDEHLDTLKDLRGGCSRIMEITVGLRKFAYPETGGTQRTQVNDSLRTALQLMAAEIGDQISVQNRITDDVTVQASGSWLSKIFMELIHNCTHALRRKIQPPDSLPKILIEAAVEGNRTVISVTDNGTGISDGDIKKIFDPFFTTRNVGQGVGLSLGICHQILQQFGATLTVESEVGIYTRFDMSFPDPKLS